MLNRNDINDEYFEWIFKLVSTNKLGNGLGYRKLLSYLHSVEFRWTIQRDQNRAEEGFCLRYRFADANDYPRDVSNDIFGKCSVLEMMVALAIRCEENIMDDPKIGNRTNQWFWGMVNSLGLGAMYDKNFDKPYVIDIVEQFLDRKYAPNGKGGLFIIRNCKEDLTTVEIWYQLCWYLDSVMGY